MLYASFKHGTGERIVDGRRFTDMTEAAPPAGVDPHFAVAPAQLLQDLPERRYAGLTLWIVRGHVHQHADPAHLLGLLRARRVCTKRALRRNKAGRPHRMTSDRRHQ